MDYSKVIILGAGLPFSGEEPTAIRQISGGRRVLDWILGSFDKTFDKTEFHFVGGYRMKEIIDRYPDIHFSRNEQWMESGTLRSLLSAPLSGDRPIYVCYADTVFDPDAVGTLEDTDTDSAVAIDTTWKTRYQSRDEASLSRAEKVRFEGEELIEVGTDLEPATCDAEFTGLVKLSTVAIRRTLELVEEGVLEYTDDLPDLITELSSAGLVTPVDISKNWAELETADDITRFVLDTKANTLRRLSSVIEESIILEQFSFEVAEWTSDPTSICADINRAFDGESVIVRSSALAEDTWESSNAGRFESVLDVPSDDEATLRAAIQDVVDSYAGENPNDQVLVQPMVRDIAQSGVVMTRSLTARGPYYVVNYDPTTGSTESVTDGSGDSIRTAVIRRDVARADEKSVERSQTRAPADFPLDNLLAAIQELEAVIGHDSLDVEFAIDDEGVVFILQVRPITVDPSERTVDDDELYRAIDNARRAFRESQPPAPQIVGNETIFGVMPDWNPAEIIGRRPRRLAESLYRYLIMDETWARQRAEFGYRDVRPHPLMKCFVGQPYVDVRAVFNSFVPAGVSDSLAEKLVEFYLERLRANPELHDKVEFEIAITCLPFDFDRRVTPLREAGFTDEELANLRDALGEVTRGAFERVESGRDIDRIETLESRFEEFERRDLSPLRSANCMLSDCRRLGTLPFAHLARAAFVAVSWLRSLRRKGVLTEAEASRFLNSVNTVAQRFEYDGYRVEAGSMTFEEYVDRYGHLRPGTYDITCPSYARDPESYLRPMVQRVNEPDTTADPRDIWGEETDRRIERELQDIGLSVDANRFLSFLEEAIRGREYSKFVFSKNLSASLEAIAQYGEQHGLTRDQVSHVAIEDFEQLLANPPPEAPGEWLAGIAKDGARRHTVSEAAELPPLLFSDQDFMCFERPVREPNFVTSTVVRAELHELDDDPNPDLTGKVVMIPQADPGYDWLFGYDIAGLITMYGGPNSHMTIRAAEFDLPAAIGIGEDRYEQFRDAEVVELDCSDMTIRRIR